MQPYILNAFLKVYIGRKLRVGSHRYSLSNGQETQIEAKAYIVRALSIVGYVVTSASNTKMFKNIK